MMRNITIDIAKGIGILTVVLCHNWILYHDRGELSRVVFSFHMPLFFFISGLFLKKSNLTYKTILNKADTILKPYFVVSLLVLLFTSIAQHNFNIAALISVFYASGATAIWTPLWFLPHLFVVVIASTLVTQWVDLSLFSLPKLVGLLLVMAIGASQLSLFRQANFGLPLVNYVYGEGNYNYGLPFNLDLILVTMPLYLMGHMFAKQILNFKFNWIYTILAGAIFVGLHFLYNQTIELNDRQFGNILICFLQIFSGIYLVFAISSLLQPIKYISSILTYLGAASLFILIFHFSVQHKLTGILQYYFSEHLILDAYVSLIVSIIFSLIVWYVVKRNAMLSLLLLPIAKTKAL